MLLRQTTPRTSQPWWNTRKSRGAVRAEEVRQGHPLMRRFIHENVIIPGWEIVSKRVRKPTSQDAVRQQLFQHDAGIGQMQQGLPAGQTGLCGS